MINRGAGYCNKPVSVTGINWDLTYSAGMCGCWIFNEKGGKIVRDLTGRMGDAAFVSTAPLWSDLGLVVGNSKGYAEVPNTNNKSSFNPVLGNCTIRVIHKPRSWPGGFTCLVDGFKSGVGSGRIWNIFASSTAISYRGIGGGDGSAAANSIAMATGSIWDLVWTRRLNDAETGSTQVHRWYLNGKLMLTETGFSQNSWSTSGFQFSFGGNPSGGGSAYDGTYLKVQCWNRALHRGEISWLYGNPWGDLAQPAYASYQRLKSIVAAARKQLGGSAIIVS